MKKFFKTQLIHKDSRGIFSNIVNDKFKNLSIISSKKNSIRSNHYHLKDSHYIYILEGKMIYYYKKIKSKLKPKQKILKKGDIVFTPPFEIHATLFTENTTIIVASKYPRSKSFYKKDTKSYILIK